MFSTRISYIFTVTVTVESSIQITESWPMGLPQLNQNQMYNLNIKIVNPIVKFTYTNKQNKKLLYLSCKSKDLTQLYNRSIKRVNPIVIFIQGVNKKNSYLSCKSCVTTSCKLNLNRLTERILILHFYKFHGQYK